MARRSRRKQTSVLRTLFVELSALAGIFGIAQPTVRNNLWQMVQPTAVKSRFEQSPQAKVSERNEQSVPQPIVWQPEPFVPSYVPQSLQQQFYPPQASQPTYPSAYTAQAVMPRDARSQTGWSPSGYNPMGAYQ